MTAWSRFVDSFRPALDTAAQGDWRLDDRIIETTVTGPSNDEPVSVKDKVHDDQATIEQGGRSHTSRPAAGAADSGLKRRLQSRHMQMISLGGSIGTGLFVGSGSVLASGGPGFLIVDFLLVGVMLYCVVMSLGELAACLPVSGSFASYSTRFLDPAWGFAMGYNYWMQWFIAFPLELVAAAIVLDYWPGSMKLTKGVYIFIFLLIVSVINLFGVRGYGEFEFGASMVKVVAVTGFIILAIVIDTGGAPDGIYRGAATWHDPGAFVNGFKGFASVFVTAAFAFAGTELIGLAAAEAGNPRKEIPKAVKQIIWRILIFYILSLFLIGLIVPYTEPRLGDNASGYDARASPFVIAINYGQVKVLPDIFNAVILISVLSVGNSSVYGASRTLCGLAQAGQAPRLFAYIDREGRPLPAVILSLAMGCLAFVIYAAQSTTVFNWLLALSGLAAIFSWGSLCAAHIQFRRAWKYNGHTLEELPWKSPLGVYGAWFGFLFNVLVVIIQFYIAAFPIGQADLSTSERVYSFFLSYLCVPVVLAFYAFWKLYTRCSFAQVENMDITTGRFQPVPLTILRREREEERRKPAWRRIVKTLV